MAGLEAVRQLPLWGDPPPDQSPAASAARPTLQEGIRDYLALQARVGKAAHTLDASRRDLAQLVGFIGNRGLSQIGTADLQAFVESLARERRNGVASLRRKIATVKALFGYLHREGLISTDAASALIYPEARDHPVERLSDSEVNRLLASLTSLQHKVLVLLICDAGLKREEALTLRGSDVVLRDTHAGYLTIQHGMQAKHVRSRTVPLAPRLAATLSEYLQGRSPDERVVDLSTRGADYVVAEAGRRAGVPSKGRLTPQRLRDTFALRWLEKRLARESAGQADPAQSDLELAELLGLAPASLMVRRYRRTAVRQEQDRTERMLLLDA